MNPLTFEHILSFSFFFFFFFFFFLSIGPLKILDIQLVRKIA